MWMRIVDVDDIKKPWQKILSSRYIVLETWMITQVALLETWWRWVLTYMLIGWFFHMLIDADIPKWRYMDNLVDKMAMVFYTYDIMWMILWWWVDICLQTYPVIGPLQVSNLEMVVREFHKEDPRIYTCFCGYSRVYVNLKEMSGPNLEWEESDRNGTGTEGEHDCWSRCCWKMLMEQIIHYVW